MLDHDTKDGLASGDGFLMGGYKLQWDDKSQQVLVSDRRGSLPIGITSRGIEVYDAIFSARSMLTNPSYRGISLCEVGAGLAEFVPAFARVATAPILVIDPINYHTLTGLFQASLRDKGTPHWAHDELQMLQERAQGYLSPKIVHCPMTFDQAWTRYEDKFIGQFDVVIDIEGTAFYGDEEGVTQREFSMLRMPKRSPVSGLVKM